jgi:hypothetical protein
MVKKQIVSGQHVQGIASGSTPSSDKIKELLAQIAFT